MSNVIIQNINLYDLELQGNSSSDEEEENIAKNQQKQPSITSYLIKKSPRQQSTENGAEKLIECEISADLDKSSSLEVNKAVKSPVNSQSSRKSNGLPQKTGETAKSSTTSSPTSQKTSTNLSNLYQNNSNQASSSTDSNTSNTQQPKITQKSTSDHQTTSNLPTEVVIKEELIEIDDDPVIQQTWQDLDQHSFIKQENELMVPPDSLDGENIMEDEIEEQDLRKIMSQSQDPENANASFDDSLLKTCESLEDEVELIKPNGDSGTLDEKFGFFYKGSGSLHKNVEQLDEDMMTSQDIPVDFDDNLMELEGNPAKRMRFDDKSAQKTPEGALSSNKIYTHTIVKSLPKGITVKRTSGRQVACKSTSSNAGPSPDKQMTSLDVSNQENPGTNGKVIAKIGQNLAKIGETFVKFGSSVKNSEQLLPTKLAVSNEQEEFIVTAIKEEPVDDIDMEQDYTEEFIEEPSEPEPERLATNSELTKTFNKNIGIVHKVGEIANRIVDRINAKRGETSHNVTTSTPKIGVSPKKFGLDPSKVGGNFIKVGQTTKGSPITSKVIITTKVIQNPVQSSSTTPQRLSMPSTSYFMPKNFLDLQIKEEKLDDEAKSSTDPNDFIETKIKEEDPDEYFTTAYNQNITSKPLNSTVTSTSDTIVSTKIVTLPASNLLKTRKIIVIKKPVTPGTKPVSGHSIQRALKSQMRSGGVGGTENTRYIIKTVSMPNKTIKIENNQKSSLQIASISGAQNQGPSTSFRTITYPKSESTVVVKNQTDAIYRCYKCHLLFSSHSEYTEHLKEHRIPQGIVFNEKRVIKLEELQKMNAFQCAQCSAGFPTMEKLSAHENRHKTEFSCKYCGKTFLQMYRYKEHLAQHEQKKEKYLECEHCDKKFLKQFRLDEHVMNAHAIMELHICAYCDLKFPSNSLLLDHQKTAHTKKTAMKCGLCNYETYVKQNFEKHASMHMRYVEKLNSNQFFKCDQCPQSFREKGVLEMHKQHMHS
ncbi:hypothetical protein ACKWTF_015195 [Chironomus riparius]